MIKNLLLIDDDETTLLLLSRLVIKNAFAQKVTTLRNGREGITYLDRLLGSPEEYRPELILLDLEMPLMNGWEFLELYTRQYQQQLPDTRICILTSALDDDELQRANDYGCVSFVWKKPLSATGLDRLRRQESIKQHFEQALP